MEMNWHHTLLADDETYHQLDGKPLYKKRFNKVLKFHSPGLAAVVDTTGAYHINLAGNPIYTERYQQTFGFYHGLAAVEAIEGWFHINSVGYPIYDERYAWCGNFQENLCTVKEQASGTYYHIDTKGRRTYYENYAYAGDYRDGVAVVCRDDGLHTHINQQGIPIHNQWLLGLDVFHKGIARAKDKQGWFHIDKKGQALYQQRYKAIEPYYNHVAHAEDFNGSLYTIDLAGNKIKTIYQTNHSYLHDLSADLVGFWKTQTIYTAVKLSVFDAIPNSLEKVAAAIQLEIKMCARLLRALQELELIYLSSNNIWQLSEKGKLLQPTSTSAMAAAALIWGETHYQTWPQLINCLRQYNSQTFNYFQELARTKPTLATYHRALSGYAEYDYRELIQKISWHNHQIVIDAGGGTATLLHNLLNTYPHLKGILLEMPEVIELTKPHPSCKYHAVDLLKPWPCNADAILLARVLHDWQDSDAIQLLLQAKNSLNESGKIYIVEMMLDPNSSDGGLLDLNMLVMTGGCERSLSDWQQLTAKAQLDIVANYHLTSIVNLLVLEAND